MNQNYFYLNKIMDELLLIYYHYITKYEVSREFVTKIINIIKRKSNEYRIKDPD